jgi:hypothetical protein
LRWLGRLLIPGCLTASTFSRLNRLEPAEFALSSGRFSPDCSCRCLPGHWTATRGVVLEEMNQALKTRAEHGLKAPRGRAHEQDWQTLM